MGVESAPPGYSRYGSVGTRIGATIIDGGVYLILQFPFVIARLARILDDVEPEPEPALPAGDLTALRHFAVMAVWILVNGLCTNRYGGSPGKLILGLRVTGEAGNSPIGLGRSLCRAGVWIVVLIPDVGGFALLGLAGVSVVGVLNDEQRRSAYDRLAGTRVVHVDPL